MSAKSIQKTLGYKKHQIAEGLSYFKPESTKFESRFVEEIHHSLQQKQKFISPKFFYDDRGSRFFKKICSLPEYYLTRIEIEILKQLKFSLPQYIQKQFRLVELGSGSSIKTRLLLDVLDKIQDTIEYMPIDISDILKEESLNLQKKYDNLQITGIIDTYETGLEFIKEYDKKPNLIAFLGSSFGNFSPKPGFEFLKKINNAMKESDLFLIGLDLIKDKYVLEGAYNDSQGITAQFNLNILRRINQELDGNFNLENFSHVAFYNDDENRIEIHLRSLENQSVQIPKANLSISFEKDELIHTENSYKYSIPKIHELLQSAGFNIIKIWQDENSYFALILASKQQLDGFSTSKT